MKKTLIPLACLLVTMLNIPVQAAWPDKVFAPYMYIGMGDNFKLTACDDACGVKYYTLAFIIARQEGNGDKAVYHPEPAWDGHTPIEENLYKGQIDAIRSRGGDVIMSFGGEGGKEMANEIQDTNQLEAAYQKVIDQYHFTWLDFDVEGNNLDNGKLDSERRNTVLADLQKKNPGLIISYTLPVDPHGISQQSQDLLTDAVQKGVKIHSVDIMVMYFGKEFVGHGKSEGELGIESANTAYAQVQKIDPNIRIGLCPCLGRNGSSAEVFTLEDAKTLKAFADQTPWVCSLHYWSINDDAGRKHHHKDDDSTVQPQSYAFAKVFGTFGTKQ